ncbi:SCP-2 sterol transfer family protein [Desulfotomaculum arcticum]|uniref:SCP-2 sterol transfer family protein n=1 Tax=Desulfotruncus arcticus DSM 17038 TaxID=1121424 RepID=A0A1I2N8S6_9FIRM|nr:SCP2 sterol-binding domain-containing protein [Desulfotruncus arcticus]SFF99269.1 SCP-2 sterol transfer family protein [Desulfotomaculum arcticum] [Desulfotruncus arcticus DSM 17038]
MATHREITESLNAFQEGYSNNKKLKIMNHDWNRVILIEATDVDSKHTIILQDGEISVVEGISATPNLVVTSDSETLADLFYGDITPTEPYMNGTLVLKGSEDDIVRLDFISLMIWGE